MSWAHHLAPLVPRLRVVFADLDHARRAAVELDGIEIGVSTTANVASVHEAMLWMEFGRAQVITVARHINRRLELLKAIKALGVGLSVVAYDVCIPSCPFSGYHFGNIPVGDPADGVFRHVHLDGCHPVSDRLRRERPYLLAVKEILPGHLHRYAGVVDELKLPGRNRTTAEVLRSLDLYREGTSLEHPYRLYSEPPEAWDVIAHCDRNCPVCGYCKEHIIPGTVDVFASPVPLKALQQDEGQRRPPNGWRFVRSDGAKATVCVSPKGEHRVLREVAGMSVHYTQESGAPSSELVALVHAVADALSAAGYQPDTNPTPKLPSLKWPHGFELQD